MGRIVVVGNGGQIDIEVREPDAISSDPSKPCLKVVTTSDLLERVLAFFNSFYRSDSQILPTNRPDAPAAKPVKTQRKTTRAHTGEKVTDKTAFLRSIGLSDETTNAIISKGKFLPEHFENMSHADLRRVCNANKMRMEKVRSALQQKGISIASPLKRGRQQASSNKTLSSDKTRRNSRQIRIHEVSQQMRETMIPAEDSNDQRDIIILKEIVRPKTLENIKELGFKNLGQLAMFSPNAISLAVFGGSGGATKKFIANLLTKFEVKLAQESPKLPSTSRPNIKRRSLINSIPGIGTGPVAVLSNCDINTIGDLKKISYDDLVNEVFKDQPDLLPDLMSCLENAGIVLNPEDPSSEGGTFQKFIAGTRDEEEESKVPGWGED